MEDKIPEILYHYCSVDTFLKIVQNKTLRLSEISKSNDSMECQWLERKVVPDLFQRGLNSYITSIEKDTDPRVLAKIIKVAYEIFNLPYEKKHFSIGEKFIFSACLSEEPDILSQWRGYASDGYGVSIGIDSKIFIEYFDAEEIENVKFSKVIYDKELQERDVKPEIESFIEILRHAFQGKNKIEDIVATKEAIYDTFAVWISIWQKSIYLKNDSFSEEREWRLYSMFPATFEIIDLKRQIDELETMNVFSKLGVTTKDEKLVFFIDYLLDMIKTRKEPIDFIRSVYLGPKCKLSIEDVKGVLNIYGWDTSNVEIIRSKSSYI